MLPQATLEDLARQLREARQSRTQLRHFSKQFPQMTIEDGYAIQREWVQ
ncbi:MAG: 2-oxo-hepta-3-ene-1,7-dioic acid hydratase, partial [Leptothrix sp. (in: b-proteobacteria)]